MKSFIVRAVLLAAVACASAGAALAAGGASTVTVKSASGLGAKILVNASGLTLYHYTDETKDKVDCTGGCAKLWPPLLVAAGTKPKAGPGVAAAKLGEIKRPDGSLQVTYNGLPLYRFAADTKAGEAGGQGLEHAWYAVTSKGTITKAAATAKGAGSNAPATSSPSPTPSSSGAGPYNY